MHPGPRASTIELACGHLLRTGEDIPTILPPIALEADTLFPYVYLHLHRVGPYTDMR